MWDAVSDAPGCTEVKFATRTANSNTPCSRISPKDYAGSKELWNVLQDFGQTDREVMPDEHSA